MAKQNEHGKLIAAAAKAALLPLGCRRVGQSRCWISDERFWYIFIEFQPSAWSKGTYTNVTPIWLFLQPWGGEAAHRVGNYIKFESVEQFGPLVVAMANLAAAEVVALRGKFRTPLDVHRFFAGRLSYAGNVYRAAITAGLVGDIALARQLFTRMQTTDTKKYGPWIAALQRECAALSQLLDDPLRYRSAVLKTISARRQKRGLPPDPQCLDSLDLVAAEPQHGLPGQAPQ
jgi:hypothetical protein